MKLCIFIAATALVVCCAGIRSEIDNNEPKLWAILIAGSSGWENYGDQASVLRSYHIVRKHGVPDERIIMFYYDDIANDPNNPFPGKVFNKPGGANVYPNVPKDYTGDTITPDNFINVLKGNDSAMQGIGSGRVLKSGPNDHVFVYFNDHGGSGILAFPNDMLTVQQLQDTIKFMHEQKMYGKMVFYVDACFSGSMFEGVLPNNINVFATTSANTEEEAYNCFCFVNPFNDTCISAEYSGGWMDDSESEDVEKETLQEEFKVVKEDTFHSHVSEYGQLSIGKLKLGQFLGPKETKHMPTVICPDYTDSLAENVPVTGLKRKLAAAKSKQEYLKLQNKLNIIQLKRALVNATIDAVALEVTGGDMEMSRMFITKKSGRVRNMQCHHKVVKAFSAHCFNMGKNPYAIKFANLANNLCNEGLSEAALVDSIQRICAKALGGTV